MAINAGMMLKDSADIREGYLAYGQVLSETFPGYNGMDKIFLFGRGVDYKAGVPGTQEPPTLIYPLITGVLRGVCVGSHTVPRISGVTEQSDGSMGYAAANAKQSQQMVSFVTKGIIAVKTLVNVTKGDRVHCVVNASGALTDDVNLGMFSNVATAGRSVPAPTTWEWFTTTVSGKIGLILLA